jgi:hypothetical protein
MLALLMWAVPAAGSVTHTTTTLDSTHTSFTVEIDTDTPDSSVRKIVILVDKSNPPTTRTDSITSSITDPDTIQITGLDNGIDYYYRTLVSDSTSIDTSAAKKVSTLDLTQVIADYDSTHTSLLWETNYANPDSGVKKIVLLCDKNNPPTTRVDSVTASITDPDSLAATGLDNGAQYFARFEISDSAFTDTSAVDSATTKDATVAIACIDTQYTSLMIEINPANPDSGWKQYTLLWGTANPPTTHQDSVTASLTDPDSLSVASLTQNTWYWFRWIAADSAFTDTSAIDSAQTNNMTQVLTVVDTTTSYFKVEINPSAADSGFKKIVLLASTSSPPTTHVDSVTTGCTDPDSLSFTGGVHGVKYYYRAIVTDSTHTDTSGVGSVTLEGMGFALTVVDTTYRNIKVECNQSNVDSSLSKLVLQIKGGLVLLDYTTVDSVTTVTDPDTLEGAPAPSDLTDTTWYFFRFIATDSTGVDTSDYDSVMTHDWSLPSDYITPSLGSGYLKKRTSNHYHFSFTYNQSEHSFVSDTLDISEFEWMKIGYRLWGEDNNHTFDSTIVAIYSHQSDAIVVADTLSAADADTATVTKYFPLRSYNLTDSSGSSQTSLYDWGYNVWIEVTVTDSSASVGDTMDCDVRYVDGDIVFK